MKHRNRRTFLFLIVFALFLGFIFWNGIYPLTLFQDIGISLYRIMIGFSISVVLGTGFAFLIGLHVYIKWTVKPVLLFLLSIPTIAWVPILMVISGISEQTIIFAIFLGSFFSIVTHTLEGLENVDTQLIKVGQIMGYSKWKVFLSISLPASFGMILVGLKLGVSYSWRALVGAELLVATQSGLGFLVFSARRFYNLERMLVCLMLIGFLGYAMNRLVVGWIEKKTIDRWYSYDY